MLKLAWLGPPVAELDGVQIHFETRKIAALLAYLSLNPRGCAREKLAALFWPEFDQTHAMANLRRALGSLTRALPPNYIETNRESVRWVQEAHTELDVMAFQELIRAVRTHAHESDSDNRDDQLRVCPACLDRLETACELNRGDLLDGLNLPDAPAFDEWQYLTRAELNRELAWALEHWAGVLVSQAVAAGQVGPGQPAWEKAAAVARRWLSLDRLEAGPHLALVRTYVLAGQRSLAQRQVEEFNRLHYEEFGQDPDKDTQAAFQYVLAQGHPHRGELQPIPQVPVDSRQVLLKTKMYLPRVKSSRVSRPRLLSKMNGVGDHKLTLISAPAGFGKTSLLAEWSAQTDLLVGWFSLDSSDNDPHQFLSYLCAALESLQEGVAGSAVSMLESAQPVPPKTILTMLLKGLEQAAEPLVIVLDDYQFISGQAIHEAVAYILERSTAYLHLVIASRADPPLPLARLRADGELLDLRTDDLRFNLEECEAFFSHVMRLDITPEGIQALAARTEGWAVGLQMAGITLQGTTNQAQFIQTFSGSHRYILEYLIQEVLDRQPAHVRDFLLKTSILDRLCGELCEAVVGTSPEPVYSILDYLEHSNLFLIPLDQECHWYRYHHLFADLLRNQLQKSVGDPGVTKLHLYAAKWHEQNGSILDAIHHASLASDEERVERFIEQHYMEMVSRGEMSGYRFWAGKLNKELIYRRPWLCIYEAYSHAWFGELDEADHFIEVAEKHIRCDISAPESYSMQGHLAYVKSRVTAMRGDIHRAIEFCLAACEYTPASNLTLQFDTRVTLGYEYFLSGDYANASQILNEAIRTGITARAIIYVVAASCILSRLFANQGLLKKSFDTYQTPTQLIPTASGEHRDARALVEVGIADVLCEWNDLNAALVHVKRGLALLPFWGKVDDSVLAFITLARIHLAQGNRSDAIEAVERAIQLVQTRGVFSEARNVVETAQVKMWLVQGDRSAVDRWAVTLKKRFGPQGQFRFEDELTHITQARVFIAQNKLVEALGLLSRLEINAQSGSRKGRLIEILNLQALVQQALGRPALALEVLARSLALAEPEGYIRIFLDEGEPMKQLLAEFSSTVPDGHIRDYALRLK